MTVESSLVESDVNDFFSNPFEIPYNMHRPTGLTGYANSAALMRWSKDLTEMICITFYYYYANNANCNTVQSRFSDTPQKLSLNRIMSLNLMIFCSIG